MESRQNTVFTIGHSTHSYERFLRLLRQNEVTAIADVRTTPFSRHQPHFSREILQDELKRDGLAYVFLGKELGGRPSKYYFSNGIADYEKMATNPEFIKGLNRVIEGALKHRIALMCSEHDPMDCHRCLLVGRFLVRQGVNVEHIASDEIISHHIIEQQLLASIRSSADDLFLSKEERLATAYREQAKKVAYAQPEASTRKTLAAG